MIGLYPIVRRFRRPLLPLEAPPAPAAAPAPVPVTSVSAPAPTVPAVPVPPPPVEPPPPEIPPAGADNTEPLLVLAAPEGAASDNPTTPKGKKPCPKKTSAA